MNFLDPVQFFRFLKGHCHGNQFCVVPDFFARSQSISGSAGPIFTIFAPYVDIELQMINPTFFVRYLKGRCHGNQFYGKLTYSPALITLSFQNRMGIATSMCVLTAQMMPLYCVNFVKFDPVTPELTELIVNIRYNTAKKMAHLVKYLRIYWTDFRNLLTT